MARFSRIRVATVMKETGMVPLFYNSDIKIAKNILKACYDGGARVIEFTTRGDFAFEIFSELNKFASKECPDVMLGIGSITDAGAASLFIQMGASFIVTPSLREDIVRVCNRKKVLSVPGCGSLYEINKAEELGCEIIKLFPGATYGPNFVKAVKGPQPWTSIMPTGGVGIEESDLKMWFEAGVTCVGIGSNLISKQVVKHQDYSSLQNQVKEILNRIQKIRNEL
ncbi:bifunctional 4-hydroxy-2-oxoglutarate aldolase/2-dehydro-3-deoxy-phosphogluconate aldolase [Aquimarina aggregata]|uniref:bifunctional 4-hydroxy-2-oxoglutarate aldolase/2-dehydro-3-deoxy-phosphogluconate aldolase n=1 Tax=Aquimarina aggregata TaxID=1642818 RepID=UPI002491DC49|nr:bifunctional 4-hydroxy-2-oxoglutarate aldolase/2-dehydro-3-deoxy-phosphogluconate aldolase [Aquimarina aggregata]